MDAKLIAEEGTCKGLVFLLEQEHEWFLGRDPDLCTLLIEDPKVSRQHALLTKSDEGFLLENLSHTNPILISGVTIEGPTLLKEGDRIKIGGTTFHFTTAEVQTATPAFVPTSEVPETTIFEPISEQEALPHIDLQVRDRWLLKVIVGPQIGAEFSMTPGKEYVIGSDASLCDIILYDLSVSRKHASIRVAEDNNSCTIQDLESRNGTLVNGQKITGPTTLNNQEVVLLGTTSFVIIDREAASKTILATAAPREIPQVGVPGVPIEKKEEAPPVFFQRLMAAKEHLLVFIILLGIIIAMSIGISSLFNIEEKTLPAKNEIEELAATLKPFPDITYNYNKGTGTLFLVGHLLTPTDKNQLEYDLKKLPFLSSVDDSNIVVDQYIWQEMNSLIARNPIWSGVSIHSPKPGIFVVTGYLKTRQEGVALNDYLNLNFPYLDRLQNKVTIEEDLLAALSAELFVEGMNGVAIQIIDGEIVLSGFIANDMEIPYQQLLTKWKQIPGVRQVKNFVVPIAPSEAVINLSDRYHVTGFSTHDQTNINVVINGRILTRGDALDGMTITSIQRNAVFLEKDGLKFKIEYNQQ